LLFVAAASVGIYFLVQHTQDNAEEWAQFTEYRLNFKKSYADSEVQTRFEAFVESLKAIRHYRQLEAENPSGSATFGVNEFSDLTPQEFEDMFLGLDKTNIASNLKANSPPTATSLGASPSVTSLNWTDSGIVTPVRNQGSCGSCWAFACVGTVESVYLKNELTSGGVSTDIDDFHLSVQQMVSCDDVNYGCMGGWPIDAFGYVQDAGGLALEDDYPYKAQTGSCNNNFEDSIVSGTEPSNIDYGAYCSAWANCNNQDEEGLAASLETYGPHVVCVNASPWQYYTGGVLSADVCNTDYGNGRRVLNHAVILTGFDMTGSTVGDYWSIKNSWSTSWGDNGYIHLEMGSNTCGVMNDALYIEI